MEWWEFLLVLAITLPIMVMWIACLIDAIARPDLSGWVKAAWMLFILFFPLVGSLVYVITRPTMIISDRRGIDATWGVDPNSLPNPR